MDNEILIHQALEEQRDLPFRQAGMTAVEQFAFRKDFKQIAKDTARYRELIPKTTPGPGQQYAFEVNLDACSGCKACVTACHNENGLEEDETWRSVGLLHGPTPQGPAIQHVTGACHHCLEPACLQGCPVKAYDKDLVTGVVKHLDDQCIGCQYCILKCPYDVPKYSKKKGIVHKCDMCISRLKANEAPACVRACPHEAIRITLVDTAVVRAQPKDFVNVPQAPDSSYTLPTTTYTTKNNYTSTMTAMNAAVFEPEHPHMPLVVMLVLTQLSVGAFCVGAVVNQMMNVHWKAMFLPMYTWAGLGGGLLALGSSVFHLGRPLYAFRAILGLKTSWLSREILSFGVFAALAFFFALFSGNGRSHDGLGVMVLTSGVWAIFTSVMVYRDTHRKLWDNSLTTFKFYMTAVILGTASVLAISLTACIFHPIVFRELFQSIGIPLAKSLVAASVIKLLIEASLFSHLRQPVMTELKKSASLMIIALKPWTIQRFIYGILGGIVLPVLMIATSTYLTMNDVVIWSWVIMMVTITAEMMERYLFFRAVIPLKMPQ